MTGAALVLLLSPILSEASSFSYAGWIPFWEKDRGISDLTENLTKVHSVSPFSYEVRSNGTLVDKIKIDEGVWPIWRVVAKQIGVKVIPTVAWFDGEGIHKLLTNTKKRRAHEDAIAKLVKDKKFDGIDIDYEAKKTETMGYFSLFIKGLAIRLHPMGKTLSCTIESRMPVDSRYNVVPGEKIEYANDYKVLNRYCDEVRIMAYDQGGVDRLLNDKKGNGALYAPVADPEWAEKLIKEAMKTINPKKIVLGVPTYGYEYQATWDSGITTYRRLRSVNYNTAMTLANLVGAVPARNAAGELGFWYGSSSFVEVSPALRRDVSSTEPAEIMASKQAGKITRFVSLSDAEAVAQKIALAKKYNLKGVVLFKFDGGHDPLIWTKLL
ncbi:MAG: glycosyl hydrolase family 18 protein [Patescibacteria group bacterium]